MSRSIQCLRRPPPPRVAAVVVGRSVFHITWSLNSESWREAKESNTLLASHNWRALATLIVISLIPARF